MMQKTTEQQQIQHKKQTGNWRNRRDRDCSQAGQRKEEAQDRERKNQVGSSPGSMPIDSREDNVKVIYVAMQNLKRQNNFHQQRRRAPQMGNVAKASSYCSEGGFTRSQESQNLAFNGNCFRCNSYRNSSRSCTNQSLPEPINECCSLCKSQTHDEREYWTLSNACDILGKSWKMQTSWRLLTRSSLLKRLREQKIGSPNKPAYKFKFLGCGFRDSKP